MYARLLVLAWLLSPLPAAGQPLRVFSEFQRPGRDGEIVRVDRMEFPRELLSPAIPRNGFTSYHIAAEIPANTKYFLEVGQNPEHAVRIAVYKAEFNGAGIPDALTPVQLPYEGYSETEATHVFWMDVWVDARAPVGRIKIEPQLHLGYWITYPMEARITPVVVPPYAHGRAAALPGASARSDAGVLGSMRKFLCGIAEPPGRESGPPTVRAMIRRNVEQDMALAGSQKKDAVQAAMAAAAGFRGEGLCNPAAVPSSGDSKAEWYLRVRDFLYQAGVN